MTNVLLQGQETNARIANVEFDLAWDNSWRGAENWDAAWVFVKFRAPGSNEWQHAELSTNDADHAHGADSIIDAVPDGKGAFIYRSSAYTGNVSYAHTRLRWNYGSNGYNFAKNQLVEVSVHAIEMVYIPEGPFYLGSGGTEAGHFYRADGTSQNTNLYPVLSEAEIAVGTTSGKLYYTFGGSAYGDGLGPISNGFPKGYSTFYCMKYEITQGQYADFLNKLTPTQWTNCQTTAYYGSIRHTISGPVTNVSAGRPDRACNYLDWEDGIAYAAWAGLRPMSELEFEKACRGPAYPVPNEYAWGTTDIMADVSRGLSGPENGTETVTNSNVLGPCNYGNKAHSGGGDGLTGPLRAGIFATNNATRITSGASYYGVMELSGNNLEWTVTVGNPEGRIFQGTLGNGVLAADGSATNNADWPASATATGAGFRGGYWGASGSSTARVSDRSDADTGTVGMSGRGFRAVRQVP